MTILEELIEFLAAVTQNIASEGFKRLLPKPKQETRAVTYGSVDEAYFRVCDNGNINYVSTEYCEVEPPYRPSALLGLIKSCWTSFVLTLLVGFFLLGGSATLLVYLNLNTSNLCSKWNSQVDELPKDVMGLKFVADVVETIVINLWLPWTLSILFHFSVFKKKYMKALAVCLVVGLLTVLYKSILFASGIYQRKPYYNFPSNILFAFGVIYTSYVVADKIKKENPTVSRSLIMVKLCIQFIAGSIVCNAIQYIIVPWFNKIQNEKGKIVAAAFAPSSALIPKAVSLYFAAKTVAGLTNPERAFILAWFPHGVGIITFRMMQSDLKSLEIFTALCVFNGVVNLFVRLTVRLRRALWIFILGCLKRIFCIATLQITPRSLPLEQRINADISIQTMLCETTSLILCQAYYVLYIITNFKVSLGPILKDFIVKISVAMTVDLYFNSLSIFLQTHWYNVPIRRVWSKHWQVHLVVSFVTILMTVMYFSPVLLTVVRVNSDNTPSHEAKNCSLPLI